jgi:L-rhamnose-H+ transport protein
MWGLISNEWKGVSKKTLYTIVAGVFIVIAAVVVVGKGNSLKPASGPQTGYVKTTTKV